MPRLKLRYFDLNGGRGETARLAMWIGNVPFEDERFQSADWPTVRETTPFRQAPVLEIDGAALTQANTINRYVGKLAGLYPDDPLQAAYCDEVMSAIDDITVKVGHTLFMQDQEEKRRIREELAAGPFPLYITRVGEMLTRGGGEYFAGQRLSVADLKAFVWTRHLRSGKLDYFPDDLPDRFAPNLVAHCQRLEAHPGVRAWYAAH